MAAQAWKLYNRAIRKLGTGTIVLPGAIRIALHGSGGNFATKTLTIKSTVTDEVTTGNGYTAGGKALASEAWTASGTASAGQIKFDAADPIWTATGGAINSIKGAVLFTSIAVNSGHLLAFASLTSTAFNLGSGNTLQLVFNSAGIFTAANA